jgi:hypothetical protein
VKEKIGTESHRANYDCTLRVSVTVFATAAVQSFDNGLLKWCYLNETESGRAIYNCTWLVSVTGPTTGLSNPCLDTQHLLCLVMYCSRGGEIGTESHRATYNCTLRVSVMVSPFRTSAVQSSDNGLLTGC